MKMSIFGIAVRSRFERRQKVFQNDPERRFFSLVERCILEAGVKADLIQEEIQMRIGAARIRWAANKRRDSADRIDPLF